MILHYDMIIYGEIIVLKLLISHNFQNRISLSGLLFEIPTGISFAI